jgi:two-component system, NarL family, invasion response regulator UvrY
MIGTIGVLIVDDEPDIRLVLRLTMRPWERLEVVGEAGSGSEAIAICEQSRPSIVLLDQMMPGMTGLETAREILHRWSDQLIVLCSAYLDEDIRIAAEEVGIRAAISKDKLQAVPGMIVEIVDQTDPS